MSDQYALGQGAELQRHTIEPTLIDRGGRRRGGGVLISITIITIANSSIASSLPSLLPLCSSLPSFSSLSLSIVLDLPPPLSHSPYILLQHL